MSIEGDQGLRGMLPGEVEKRKVRRAYNEMGGRLYDLRYREEQRRKFDAALSRVSLSEEDLVLDVGCGTGLLPEEIGRNVGFAVGVDLSQALLSWARSKLREVQNLDLLLSDADYLPFREEVFDAVFAITLLQNLPEPRKTLSEAMRVAKPEAPIVVSGLKKKYGKKEFEDLLSSTGLRVREIMDGELKDFVAICGKKVS